MFDFNRDCDFTLGILIWKLFAQLSMWHRTTGIISIVHMPSVHLNWNCNSQVAIFENLIPFNCNLEHNFVTKRELNNATVQKP